MASYADLGIMQRIVFAALRADVVNFCHCSSLSAANTILCIMESRSRARRIG
jgi:hypothetical protein